jgi:hypothetical protein
VPSLLPLPLQPPSSSRASRSISVVCICHLGMLCQRTRGEELRQHSRHAPPASLVVFERSWRWQEGHAPNNCSCMCAYACLPLSVITIWLAASPSLLCSAGDVHTIQDHCQPVEYVKQPCVDSCIQVPLFRQPHCRALSVSNHLCAVIQCQEGPSDTGQQVCNAGAAGVNVVASYPCPRCCRSQLGGCTTAAPCMTLGPATALPAALLLTWPPPCLLQICSKRRLHGVGGPSSRMEQMSESTCINPRER